MFYVVSPSICEYHIKLTTANTTVFGSYRTHDVNFIRTCTGSYALTSAQQDMLTVGNTTLGNVAVVHDPSNHTDYIGFTKGTVDQLQVTLIVEVERIY